MSSNFQPPRPFPRTQEKTRLDLIPIVELNLRQKVSNLVIINSLFIAKVNLPNFLVNRQHLPPFQSPSTPINHLKSVFKRPQNHHKSTTHSRQTHKFNAVILDEQFANLTKFSPANHCLLHSLTHTTIIHQQQFRLSTQILYVDQYLIAIAQPNFQQNILFPLHTPIFWSGVAHRNCTTLLALKRFLCGYEVCHLSTTKVRSPRFSCKFSLWTPTPQHSPSATPTNHSQKSLLSHAQRCQTLLNEIFSSSPVYYTRNWRAYYTNFIAFPALCPLSSICLQQQTKKPAALSSSPASQQINSTLKHSRSALHLSFSVSHSLTLIFLFLLLFTQPPKLFISSKSDFHSTCHLPSILLLHFNRRRPPTSFANRQQFID